MAKTNTIQRETIQTRQGRRYRSPIKCRLAVLSLAVVCAAQANAQAPWTWVGQGNTSLWSNPNNWYVNTPPPDKADLYFIGSYAYDYNSVADSSGYIVGSLTINALSPYHISGGRLTLLGDFENVTDAQYLSNQILLEGRNSIWTDAGWATFNGGIVVSHSQIHLKAYETTTFSGGISGDPTSTISVDGGGTILLNAFDSFGGKWNLNHGALKLGDPGAIQNANIFLNRANAINFNSLASANIGSLNGSSDLNYGATNLNFNGSGAYTGNLTGSGTLGGLSSGNQALQGQNTAGGINLGAGTLTLETGTTDLRGNASITGTGALDVKGQGALNLANNQLVVSDGSAMPLLDVSGMSSAVTNVGSFYTGQQGAGQTVIEQGGSISASTTIVGSYAGWTSNLTVKDQGSSLNTDLLGLGSDGVNSGGVGNLLISNLGQVTAVGTYLTGTSSITVNGGLLTTQILNGTPSTQMLLTDSSNGSALAVNGDIDSEFTGNILDAAGGPGGISKYGSATLTLTGANQYTGPTYVHGGTFIQHGGTNYSGFQVDPGATLIFDNLAVADTGQSTINNQGQVVFRDANINFGTLQGSGQYTWNGSTNFYQTTLAAGATVTQNGDASSEGFYIAGTYVNNGTHEGNYLDIASGGTFQDNGKVTSRYFTGNYGTLNIASGATWNNQGTFNSYGPLNVQGTLDLGGGALQSNGTFVVDGIVQNGTVQVNSEMNGTGNVPGGYNWSGGTLSFGDGHPGTLSSGTATWTGQFLALQLNDAVGSAGANWSNTQITGDLDLTPNYVIEVQLQTLQPNNTSGLLADFNASRNYLWTFATVSGAINGFSTSDFVFDTSQFANATHGTFSIVENGNALALQYIASPVPTPSSLACLGIGVTGLLLRRRRR